MNAPKIPFAVATLCLVCAVQPAGAARWVVNNNPDRPADFRSIEDAVQGAAAGDTLFIEPSETAYGQADLRKPLVIIGNGYFLNENDISTFLLTEASLNAIYFYDGSDGSSVIGLVVGTLFLSENPRGISIDRVRVQSALYLYGATDVVVTRSYIYQTPDNDQNVNVIVTNSYIQHLATRSGVIVSHSVIENEGSAESTIGNSIIINSNNPENRNSSYSNNICVCVSIPGATNSTNVAQGTLFVGGDSPDGQYRLPASSPAKGFASDGTDAGMFGGTSPYILSGLPPRPIITVFDAAASGSAESGLPVRVRARAVN